MNDISGPTLSSIALPAEASQSPVAGASAPKSPSPVAQQRHKLLQATQDFESIFIGTMLKEVRKSMAGENPLFGNSSEAKMYQGMMDEQFANQMSKNGGMGLAKVLFNKMQSRLPEDPEVVTAVDSLTP